MGSATTPTVVGAFSARNIVGDTTGTAVPANYIGEIINGSVTATNITSTSYVDIPSSLVLTAGSWLVVAAVSAQQVNDGTASADTFGSAVLTKSDNTAVVGTTRSIHARGAGIGNLSAAIIQTPITVATSTTYKLRGRVTNNTGTGTYYVYTATNVGESVFYAVRIA